MLAAKDVDMRLRIMIWNALGLPPHISSPRVDLPTSKEVPRGKRGTLLFWTALLMVGLAAILIFTFHRVTSPAP